MVTTLVLLLAAWAVMVPTVLALARLLGRVSAPRPEAAVATTEEPASDNVVALVPKPQNRLDAPARRAA